jgi:glutamine amidotransferase
MCRHLAWLGEPRSVASLVLDPPHSLLVQSYAPRRQTRVRMNADGWGVGFFTPGRDEPARWRSTQPLWQSSSFASVAPTIVSTAFVAAVRAASPGMPIDETANAPFTDGRWVLSHNGGVDRSVIPSGLPAESFCDAALLAAHVFSRDVTPTEVGDIVRELGDKDPLARLNLLLTDRSQIIATTWGDTLSFLVLDDGVVVASEPYDDDPRWVDVPDRSLLTADASGVVVTPLETPS